MKKAAAILLLTAQIFVIILSFGGCAKKETVELRFWCSKDAAGDYRIIADRFIEENKNKADITISVGVEAEETVGDSVMQNPATAADLYIFADDQLARLCSGNALLPITYNKDEIIRQSGGADSAAIQCATSDGKLYGIPITAGNGFFLFYNSDYFSEEDVQTLDGMLEIADKAGKKIAMDWSSGWYTYAFFGGAGLELDISSDGTRNECNWNSDDVKFSGVDVAKAMLDIASHESFLNITNDEVSAMFDANDQSVIAAVNGPWNTVRLQNLWGDKMRSSKLPTYTIKGEQAQMKSFAGYKLIGVNSNTKNPEWAQRFADYIANYDNQLYRYQTMVDLPAHIEVAALPEVLSYPAAKGLNEQAPYAVRQRVAGSYWLPMTEFGTLMASGNPDNLELDYIIDKLVEQITSPS